MRKEIRGLNKAVDKFTGQIIEQYEKLLEENKILKESTEGNVLKLINSFDIDELEKIKLSVNNLIRDKKHSDEKFTLEFEKTKDKNRFSKKSNWLALLKWKNRKAEKYFVNGEYTYLDDSVIINYTRKFKNFEIFEAYNVFCEDRKYLIALNGELKEIGETNQTNFRFVREVLKGDMDIDAILAHMQGSVEVVDEIEELIDED